MSAFMFGLRRALLVRRTLQVAVTEPGALATAPDAPGRRALPSAGQSGRAVHDR
jgi:hypothetical protein